MYRVGIVGAGGMGRLHAGSFASLPDFEVVAFMDIRGEQSEPAAERYKAVVYDDFGKMLMDARLDVLVITTPSAFHHEYALVAIRNGVHVFLEKPMALTSQECQELAVNARQSNVVLMVGHVVRFFTEYVQARNRVLAGDIGRPAMIRTTRECRMPIGTANWFSHYELSGGVMLDLMLHDLDYALWCFGPARRVYAKAVVTDPHAVAVNDHAFLTVKFQNGVIGHFEASWALPDGFYFTFEISGSGGIIQYDARKCMPLLLSERAKFGGQNPGVFLPESPLHESPYLTEIKHFSSVLKREEELRVKPEEALESVRLVECAWESLKTGQPVNVPGGKE